MFNGVVLGRRQGCPLLFLSRETHGIDVSGVCGSHDVVDACCGCVSKQNNNKNYGFMWLSQLFWSFPRWHTHLERLGMVERFSCSKTEQNKQKIESNPFFDAFVSTAHVPRAFTSVCITSFSSLSEQQ